MRVKLGCTTGCLHPRIRLQADPPIPRRHRRPNPRMREMRFSSTTLFISRLISNRSIPRFSFEGRAELMTMMMKMIIQRCWWRWWLINDDDDDQSMLMENHWRRGPVFGDIDDDEKPMMTMESCQWSWRKRIQDDEDEESTMKLWMVINFDLFMMIVNFDDHDHKSMMNRRGWGWWW